jgi:hypothetical protein
LKGASSIAPKPQDHQHGGLMEGCADRRPTPRKNVSMGSHRREKEVGLFGEDPSTQLRLRHSPCHRRGMAKKKDTMSFQIRPIGHGNFLRALRHSTASSRQDLQLHPKLKHLASTSSERHRRRWGLRVGLGRRDRLSNGGDGEREVGKGREPFQPAEFLTH